MATGWKGRKKFFTALAVLLSAWSVFGAAVPLQAEGNEAEEDSASSESALADWPEGIDIESECAIVIEASTGTVLYEKNADETCYPASITKIMTAMLVLELSELDETVTFSEDAVYTTEGSGIYRNVGEEMSVEDTLYAMMLESANECAYALAEHAADGDYDAFIELMNERAQELGCTGTNFTNAHGLPDTEHVTTCRDMALIAQAAIRDDMFRTLISTVSYTLPETNMSDPLTLYNHHKMICNNRTSKYLYDYAIGGKTGYTSAAGNTLVTYAEKDGMMLICVLMKSGTYCQWTDTQELFDYCFENFTLYNVADNETRYSGGIETGSLIGTEVEDFAEIDPDAAIVLPAGADFSDTVTEANYDNASDTVLGSLVYTYGDHTVGTADVILTGAEIEITGYDAESTAQEAAADASDTSAAAAEGSEDDSGGGIEPDRELIIRIAVIAVIVIIIILFLWRKISKRRSRGWKEMERPKRDYVTIRDGSRRRKN